MKEFNSIKSTFLSFFKAKPQKFEKQNLRKFNLLVEIPWVFLVLKNHFKCCNSDPEEKRSEVFESLKEIWFLRFSSDMNDPSSPLGD